jgi:hypothetical protein
MPHEVGKPVNDIHGGMKLVMGKLIIAEKLSVIDGIGLRLLRDFHPMITVCTIWRAMSGNGASMNIRKISMPRVPETILWRVD